MKNSELKTVAFVFARGGSKGVPRKNIKPLSGKPLIAYSIEIAKAMSSISSVVVSTDDAEIADVAISYGAEVPFLRPQELAKDTSPEWLAWRHAIEWVQRNRGPFDIFLSLPTTSPFRAIEDVDACIAELRDDAEADAVITVASASRSPYFNMVTLDKNGYADLVIKPAGNVTRRQDAPIVYDITTVAYAARPAFVMKADRLLDGNVRAVVVPQERAMDIDTAFDFEVAEALLHFRGAKIM